MAMEDRDFRNELVISHVIAEWIRTGIGDAGLPTESVYIVNLRWSMMNQVL